MNEQTNTLPKPVVIVQDNAISSRGVTELRKAGYTVIRAKDAKNITHFRPDQTNTLTDAAKIALAEWLLTGFSGIKSYDDICKSYIHFLKQTKAF